MSYRPFKRQQIKINVAKLDDFDLFFEEIPPVKAYKLKRAINRNIRKLKFA